MKSRTSLTRLVLIATLASLLGGCAVVPLYQPYHGGHPGYGYRGPGPAYYPERGPGFRGGPPPGVYYR